MSMKKSKFMIEDDGYSEDQLLKDVAQTNAYIEELVKLTRNYVKDCERLAGKIGGSAMGPSMEAGMYASDAQNAIEEGYLYKFEDNFNENVIDNIAGEWEMLIDDVDYL